MPGRWSESKKQQISKGLKNKPKSEEHKKHLSESKTGNMKPEHKEALIKANKGREKTPDEIDRISKNNLGKHSSSKGPQSEEVIKHLSEVRKGSKRPEITKQKMRKPHKCTTRSPMKESTKLKIGLANINHPVTQETKDKVVETKRKNNSFNSSKPENEIFNKLKLIFGEEDVSHEYNKDPRYPFRCDFYIKSLDLFIELNLHWTHGEELFDNSNLNHLNILNKWKEKAKTSKFYSQAIYIWTDLDVRKQLTAKQNNLNYLVIYNKDFKNFDEIIATQIA